MSTRSEAAVRANATRRARREFAERYPETAEIARDVLQGFNTADIAWVNDIPTTTVAAVKANLNRYGHYSYLAGLCNY